MMTFEYLLLITIVYNLRDLIVKFYYLFIYFWPLQEASRMLLVPWPGIEPTPPTGEAWSLNHWTTREVHLIYF